MQFLPGQMGSLADFFFGQGGKFLDQTPGDDLFAGQSQEGIPESDGRIFQFIHIIFNIFRVGSDNRAVVMINGIFKFSPLVGNACLLYTSRCV